MIKNALTVNRFCLIWLRLTLEFGKLLKCPLLGSIDRCFAHLTKNVWTVFEWLENIQHFYPFHSWGHRHGNFSYSKVYGRWINFDCKGNKHKDWNVNKNNYYWWDICPRRLIVGKHNQWCWSKIYWPFEHTKCFSSV